MLLIGVMVLYLTTSDKETNRIKYGNNPFIVSSIMRLSDFKVFAPLLLVYFSLLLSSAERRRDTKLQSR
jgi:hypothetical protein